MHERPLDEFGFVLYMFHGFITVEWDTDGPGKIENLRQEELEVVPEI